MARSRGVRCFLLLALTGCGSAKNHFYPGEPLATLHGELLGADALVASEPIKLAMLWYSVQDPFSSTNPPAIVSSDVDYQGSFPISYSFNLYDPPPDAAVTSLRYSDQTIQVATGIIAAYQDNNHNGVLDIIPTDGDPADTILGVSMPGNGDPYSSRAFTVSYNDRALPTTETLTATSPGFHLRTAGREIPLDISVPIQLTSAPDLNLFVCAQLFAVPQVPPAAGTPCAVQPAPRLLQVVAAAGNPKSYFSVTNGSFPVPDAEVTVDGQTLSLDPSSGLFSVSGLNAGSHVFRASVPGLGSTQGSFVTLDSFQIATPRTSPWVTKNRPIVFSWKSVAGAVGYHVYVNAESSHSIYDAYTAVTTLSTAPLSTADSAGVSVIAYGPDSLVDAIDPETQVEVVTQIIASSQADLSVHGGDPLQRSPTEARLLRSRFIP